jgi:hypothetical protein
VHLPIDVRFGHVIKIDQGERTHTAARKRLSNPRADTTDPNHSNVGLLQRKTRLRAIQTIKSTKTPIGIESVAQLLCCVAFLHDLPKKSHSALDKSPQEEDNLPLIL